MLAETDSQQQNLTDVLSSSPSKKAQKLYKKLYLTKVEILGISQKAVAIPLVSLNRTLLMPPL